MAEENVTVVVSILKSDLTTSVFEETHSTTTTIHGLINLNIGSIEDLNTINWTMDEYFIEISINETVMGTSQLLSVPYSLHAKTAETITGTITENQISDLDHFTTTDETDPVYNASVASEITSTDTSYWNDKLDSYNEIDPLFDASVASGVTSTDTANWNNKSEFDGDFSSLYNSPNLANTTLEKNIPLNTNDATSSLNITKNNGASVMKVDGTGRITGDGSGLSNVKPLLNYVGGDQRYQITANYGTYNNVRSVTMTAPSNGVCFVMASGYVDWESIN